MHEYTHRFTEIRLEGFRKPKHNGILMSVCLSACLCDQCDDPFSHHTQEALSTVHLSLRGNPLTHVSTPAEPLSVRSLYVSSVVTLL